MKGKPVLCKSLVVGVIILFVGIGIQPAFAVTSNSTGNKDDCNLCPKINKQQIDKLITRLDKYEKYDIQSVLSTQNPIKEEIFQSLSKKITSDEKLSSNSSICEFLEKYFLGLFLRAVLFSILFDIIYETFFPLFSISLDIFYEIYMAKFMVVLGILVNLSFLYDCPEWPWPPPYV